MKSDEMRKERCRQPRADPQMVFNLCRWIYMYGIEVEGVLRISGSKDFITKKTEKVMNHSTHFLEEMNHGVNDAHNVVGVLKNYLREMTMGIFDIPTAQAILKADNKKEKLIEVVITMSDVEQTTLCIVLNLVEAIVQLRDLNSMGTANSAVVLGPLLVHSNGAASFTGTQLQLDLATLLIESSAAIRRTLNIDAFFAVNEILSDFDTPAEYHRGEAAEDNFVYDISCLDQETQDSAKNLSGWMETVLSENEESCAEAVHWMEVFHSENPELFMYITNMLSPEFVVAVIERVISMVN